jgi:two-component system chemotaxis sensor kinase CheA
MDDLLTDFIAEAREMLAELSGQIVAWEAAPDDRARLDEIFRFVHTVKGNSGFFDLPRIQALSHAAEDVLAEIRSGKKVPDRALVSAVLVAIDRIGLLVEALETGVEVPGDETGLIAALAGAAAVPAEVQAHRQAPRSIRLSVDLLDRIMSGVSDAVLARNELARRMRETSSQVDVEAAFERVSASIAEIRDAVMRTRMQRIDALFAPLPRLVRDLSAELGKEVALVVEGGDVELDREMIEMIRDPLIHIVRNAIDHGIEQGAARTAAGKPAAGTLRVCARQAGNQILIEIVDDGRGVDGEALVRRALATGLLTSEAADSLSTAQRTALIFAPGLSTADAVTAVSGRGVGMDVVRANIERIGGVVDVESREGQGLRISIRVPLTLTIIPALTVSAGGQTFAIPRSATEEIVRGTSDAVRFERVGGAVVMRFRGQRLPVVDLSGLFGSDAAAALEDQTVVLLRPVGGELYALAVDAVHDHEELVVKPAAPQVMAAGIYAGTTLADDGRPVLLLDPSGIAAKAKVDGRRPAPPPAVSVQAEVTGEVPLVLFRALGGGRRAIRLAVVERIEEVDPSAVARTGGRLRVAIGDRIVPLAGIDAVPDSTFRILRLSDGASEIAYGFAEVIDIVSASVDSQPAATPGEVAGVALICGEQVELLDPHWLFAAYGAEAPLGDRPVCGVPAGDPWIDNILKPLIESLGYEVVAAGSGRTCDVVIAGEDESAGAPGAEVVRLRSRAEAGDDGSIYRYDRAALLSVLGRRAAEARKGGRNG